MNLYSDEHKRLLKAFIRYGVRFVIVGGHAAIYYGVNRNTGDLDILVEPSSQNGQKVIDALHSLNLEVPDLVPNEFEEKLVLSFGFEPEAVDILNYTPGLEFQHVFHNAREDNFQGMKVRIIDIVDLIHNKENLNRQGEKSYLDKYDIEVLKKILRKKSEQ